MFRLVLTEILFSQDRWQLRSRRRGIPHHPAGVGRAGRAPLLRREGNVEVHQGDGGQRVREAAVSAGEKILTYFKLQFIGHPMNYEGITRVPLFL